MPTVSPKQATRLVLVAAKAKQTDREVTQALIAAGVAAADAPKIAGSIRIGFKSGVQSMVMGTRAHPSGDEYYLSAFARGRAAMRFTSPEWTLVRTLCPIVLIGLIVAVLFWHFAP